MKAAWEIAAVSYFQPDDFRRALQHCIVVSRTVTFILQSAKNEVPNFDAWYKEFQDKWRADPIMTWAVDARNTIEKRGDLETHSQLKAKIVASYIGGPETNWTQAPLFFPSAAIVKAIPPKFLFKQVLDHGTLVVERRWIANTLPDHEVLSALAHVYKQMAEALLSCDKLHSNRRCDIEINSDPKSMRSLAMDRAEYVSIQTGKVTGLRMRSIPIQEGSVDAVKKRYRKFSNWHRLEEAKDFRSVARVFFDHSIGVLKKDGYHSALAFLFRNQEMVAPISIDHETRADRYVIVRELAEYAVLINANSVMLVSEAWTASGDDIPASGFAVEAKNRSEVLIMSCADAAGDEFAIRARFARKKLNKRKIAKVEAPELFDKEEQFILAPFQIAWGNKTEKDFDQ